jgi:hypothetical protein
MLKYIPVYVLTYVCMWCGFVRVCKLYNSVGVCMPVASKRRIISGK